MAEPIKVIIKDDTGTTTIDAGNVAKKDPTKPMNETAKGNKKGSVLSTASHMVLMRSINYTTSNIGKWSGNTRLQNSVNTIKTAGGYAMAFAVNPYLGALTVALDGAISAIDYAYENKWNDIRASQAQARSGGKGGYRR